MDHRDVTHRVAPVTNCSTLLAVYDFYMSSDDKLQPPPAKSVLAPSSPPYMITCDWLSVNPPSRRYSLLGISLSVSKTGPDNIVKRLSIPKFHFSYNNPFYGALFDAESDSDAPLPTADPQTACTCSVSNRKR